MNLPAPKPATYADLEAVPEHLVAEIIDRVLVTRRHMPPRQSMSHSSLLMVLNGAMGQDLGKTATWIFLSKPELHLGEHVVVPDMAGWRREQLPYIPDAPWIDLMPDWICEIVAPTTVCEDRDRKRQIYAQHGLKHYWLLDPSARKLEAFELGHGACTLRQAFTNDVDVVSEPFMPSRFSLDDLWYPGDRMMRVANMYGG
jgi:Uma2 family endonuclease